MVYCDRPSLPLLFFALSLDISHWNINNLHKGKESEEIKNNWEDMHHWDLSQKSTFGTVIVWWPKVIYIPEREFNIKQFSRVGSPKPFDHQCYSVRGLDWVEETNKVCAFQPWQNRLIGMHQERSVLGCIPLLHRISFFGRAMCPGCQVTCQ